MTKYFLTQKYLTLATSWTRVVTLKRVTASCLSQQVTKFFLSLLQSESEVAQSCLTLCDPVDCSPPGSTVHGILQARILEWVAISFSRGSSRPRDRTQVSRIRGRRFNLWATSLSSNSQGKEFCQKPCKLEVALSPIKPSNKTSAVANTFIIVL